MKKITELMEYMEITEEDLKSHSNAHEELSLRDSDKQLKRIPFEKRNKIGKFYQTLRNQGIYYTPGKNPQYLCTYLEGWKYLLESNPRSMGEKISQEQVATSLKDSIKDVIEKMKTSRIN